MIVVVNAPHDASVNQVSANEQLVHMLKQMGELRAVTLSGNYVVQGNFHLLIGGPFSLERSKGVGLARKIGADLALKLIDEGLVKNRVIFCTDADALLPKDYFMHAEELAHKDIAAGIFPFVHEKPHNDRQAEAIKLYEMRLNRYVEGLASAGSPYAFHTIGSTIAINAQHYAKVRGFPALPAGEDFYILNKLRKVGRVLSLLGEPIYLSARVSDRVLFGTGPALAKILHHDDPKQAPIFYDSQVFRCLGQFLRHAEETIQSGFCDVMLDLDEHLRTAFCSLDQGQLKKTLMSRKKIDDRLKAFHDYFDAFKTLKFIHYLRDHHFPNSPFYLD
ncbi:MAG: hypothetical protein BWZ03_00244 [bacterium ADurb.BinA186]|nr:MAG: hypothetical protein BWZ03_00244 [bacterium ADurb.BinA186]